MPDAHDQFTQATELVKPGRLDEALILFQAILKTDSNNATIWNTMGIIRFWQGEYPTSGVRWSTMYINHFYMTSIWGVPAAFPGTGRTELQPLKSPWRNTDKEHLFSRFKQVFWHFNRFSPTFCVRRTYSPAQPVHRSRSAESEPVSGVFSPHISDLSPRGLEKTTHQSSDEGGARYPRVKSDEQRWAAKRPELVTGAQEIQISDLTPATPDATVWCG